MDETRSPLATLAGLAPDAAFGMFRVVQRATFSVAGTGLRMTGAVAGAVLSTPPVRVPLGLVEAQLGALAARGAETRKRDEARVRALVTRVEPGLMDLLARAVDFLPIEQILSRVDADALVQRVDVDAIVLRVDIPRIANQVLDQIELGDLIHDSTTGIAADVRDTVRVKTMSLDDRLTRLVDRVLRRRDRDLFVPGFAPNLT